MSIEKATLVVNEDLPPIIIEWDDKIDDWTVDIPKGITRADLVEIVDEIKEITKWAD